MSDKSQTTDLGRLITEAAALAGGPHPCAVLGHKWRHIGGCNCGCDGGGNCSVPVHECEVCGDCDYGDNDEATARRADCQAEYVENAE